MRRFLTLVCLLCVAIPAGISISGCTRNPQGNYCNGLGYGLKDTDVASISMSPQTTGISLAFGQTLQAAAPSAKTCKGTSASVSAFTYGTTNNQLVDVSPTGNLCAGTWNRNSGGGIANYTICNFPSPLPATQGLPYGTAYITASAASVTSNPVEVYVHAQVTSVALAGPTSCLSQGVLSQLDAQACFVGGDKPAARTLRAAFGDRFGRSFGPGLHASLRSEYGFAAGLLRGHRHAQLHRGQCNHRVHQWRDQSDHG